MQVGTERVGIEVKAMAAVKASRRAPVNGNPGGKGTCKLPGSWKGSGVVVAGYVCSNCIGGRHSSCVSLRCACLRCTPGSLAR